MPEPAPVSQPRRARARRLRSHAVATGVSRSRRMRGLLVTPWFAAGAGFVIAAGLALNSPHTTLTYRPDTKPCTGNCTTGQTKGSMPATSPGVQIKTASPAGTGSGSHQHGSAGRHGQAGHHHGRTGGPGPAGAGVGFKILFHRFGHFGLLIMVPRAQQSQGWSLRFEIPGAQITRVWGAQWQPSGHNGGVATMPGGQPGPGGQGSQAAPGSHGPGWPHHHGWWPTDGSGFLVVGHGSPGTPVGCVLNHAACHFDRG